MVNYKLILEYDGTDFSGFQIQPEERTVQRELQTALNRLFPAGFYLTAAGRTDAGVHAAGQVITVRTEKSFSPEILKRALNANLPDDIVVKETQEVPLDFHARFSACRRIYLYRVMTVPTALQRRFVWQISFLPDFSRLLECAEIVKRQKDFKSFTKAGAETENFKCEIYESRWEKGENEWVYHITANRFLHNMVRILVGTMMEAGRGRFSAAAFEQMFNAGDRRAAGRTAPARGLILWRVEY